MFIKNKKHINNIFSRSWGREQDRQADRQREGEKGHKWNKYETMVNPLKGYATVPYILLAIFLFLVFYQSKNISKKEKKGWKEGRKKRRKERKERREGRKEGKKEGREGEKEEMGKEEKKEKEGRKSRKERKEGCFWDGGLVGGWNNRC